MIARSVGHRKGHVAGNKGRRKEERDQGKYTWKHQPRIEEEHCVSGKTASGSREE